MTSFRLILNLESAPAIGNTQTLSVQPITFAILKCQEISHPLYFSTLILLLLSAVADDRAINASDSHLAVILIRNSNYQRPNRKSNSNPVRNKQMDWSQYNNHIKDAERGEKRPWKERREWKERNRSVWTNQLWREIMIAGWNKKSSTDKRAENRQQRK